MDIAKHPVIEYACPGVPDRMVQARLVPCSGDYLPSFGLISLEKEGLFLLGRHGNFIILMQRREQRIEDQVI